jgi:NTP pyrophosphatase (non-canonical NTP hydrolase)
MNPSEYQKLAQRTECDQKKSMERLVEYSSNLVAIRALHSIIGMSGEVGELSGAIEKWLYYGQELDLINVKEEIGDLMWYIAEMCNALGLDMGSLMEANIRKLRVRYPDKFSEEKAKEENRNREVERTRMSDMVEISTTPPDPKFVVQEPKVSACCEGGKCEILLPSQGSCMLCGNERHTSLMVCKDHAQKDRMGYLNNPQFKCPDCRTIIAPNQIRRLHTSWAAGRTELCPGCVTTLQRVVV